MGYFAMCFGERARLFVVRDMGIYVFVEGYVYDIFFFLCGHLGPPSGENAVGFSFKKKKYIFF